MLNYQRVAQPPRLLVPARRQNGAFVHQILQIGAAEAGGALGDVRQGNALRQLLVPRSSYAFFMTGENPGIKQQNTWGNMRL